jgi:hypothetical protein
MNAAASAVYHRAQDFICAVIGPGEAGALGEVAEAGDLVSVVALHWLTRTPEYEGILPGTDVPAVLVSTDTGWYGVLPDHAFADMPTTYAAAAVAAALSPPGPGADVTRLAPVVAALCIAPAPPRRRAHRVTPEPAKPTLRSPRAIKVTAAQAGTSCESCDAPQVSAGQLSGCPCFAGLLSTAVVRRVGPDWLVIPGNDWGGDGIAAFLEAVR